MPKLKRLYTPWLLSLTLLVCTPLLSFGSPPGIFFAPSSPVSPVCPPSDGSSSPVCPLADRNTPPPDSYRSALNPWRTATLLPRDTVKIPQGLIITREGQLPPPALERSFLLSELAKDTVKEVFRLPPVWKATTTWLSSSTTTWETGRPNRTGARSWTFRYCSIQTACGLNLLLCP